MKVFGDQMNRTVRVVDKPLRIVSLVPSQTQLLHFLGVGERVVGITKFCIHPKEWHSSKTRVGGTKSVNIEKVKSLAPDLIIGNKEENTIEDFKALEQVAPVWMSDVFTLDDALEMIRSIGALTSTEDKASQLIGSIESSFLKLERFTKNSSCTDKRALYYIWRKPNMVSGKHTFVDDMLQKCGLLNATDDERYPEVNALDDTPDYVFLSSEPFPFKERHIDEFKDLFPESKIVLVDGEMFSWYGSKLADAPDYFERLMKKIVA